MPTSAWIPSRPSLAVLAAACLASACASVDLGPRYDPPPVRLPEPLPPVPAPPPSGAQAQPVPPVQPVPQPLPPVDPASPSAHLVTLTTRMDGASVLPPARSPAAGQLDALYDASSRLLRWKASWSGLSGAITSIQFHGPADMGQNGPPAMVWPGPFGARYEGRAMLTPQQATDLLDGLWYVNVYTGNYPQGEMRGQLRVVN
jgi:hypothetical protein